ncbi:Serine/threonine-protein phosphatase beta isoform [Trichinella zimbabwensis]|uniref:Serine/threonine-protein phosphatase n=1 Tax=Trichinella zimbabwensis TaxID=268475 RepID=A0A0V1I2E1_9BILA|nr:Serine/threonine-protein phosphatase beta isoform [Trichinella zimbabwensis]
MAVVAAWKLHMELHTATTDQLSHLEFRREITIHLLHARPLVRHYPGPRSHLPISLRTSHGHYLQSSVQGRCAVCQRNCRNECVQCKKRLHRNCFLSYHDLTQGEPNSACKRLMKKSLRFKADNAKVLETNLENAAKYEQLLIRLREFNVDEALPMEEPLLTDIFKNVSKILLKEESLLELELPLVICGDIHGNFYQLLRIFNRIGWPPKVRYLFLGDYIDRGYRNLEVIALLFTLKILYPEAVFLLRGNHEASPVNRNYGFKQEVRNRGFSTLFWLTAQITFNCLPLAAVIASKIFCAHGGISPFLKDFDQIRNFQRPLNVPSDGLIADLLWADPSDDTENFTPNEIRNTSVIYGQNAVRQFCNDFSIDLIIRAHECVEEGFAYFADGKLITIFSCPNYNGNNNGAALIIDEECKIEITAFCSISSSSSVEDEENLNVEQEEEKKH